MHRISLTPTSVLLTVLGLCMNSSVRDTGYNTWWFHFLSIFVHAIFWGTSENIYWTLKCTAYQMKIRKWLILINPGIWIGHLESEASFWWWHKHQKGLPWPEGRPFSEMHWISEPDFNTMLPHLLFYCSKSLTTLHFMKADAILIVLALFDLVFQLVIIQ